MFTPKTNLLKYAFLAMPGRSNQAELFGIRETNLERLQKLIVENIEKENVREAILYAQQASIYHGLEGLKLYLPLQLKIVENEHKRGEILEQDGINLLALVIFATKMANSDIQYSADKTLVPLLHEIKEKLLNIVKD